jgi:hypothetical protein
MIKLKVFIIIILTFILLVMIYHLNQCFYLNRTNEIVEESIKLLKI